MLVAAFRNGARPVRVFSASKTVAVCTAALLLLGVASMRATPVLAQDATQSAPGLVTSRQAHQLLRAGRITLIDIRRPSEWREVGIAAGAVPITMHQGVTKFVSALKRRGLIGKRIALICARGVRSNWLRRALAKRGITQVTNVGDGILGGRIGPGWRASGLPMRRWP